MSAFLARKMPQAAVASLLPVSSAVLPFGLLMLATVHLGVSNPSPIFGLAFLLAVFLLGLARLGGLTVLVPTALGCVLALEWTWHQQGFRPEYAAVPLLWYLSFYVLFTLYPVVFRVWATRRLPWVAAAAAGLGTFGLVYQVVKAAWPNQMMGLLPLAFSVAPLLGIGLVLKRHGPDNPARLTQLAWLAGVGLFFITLIFPLQFEKQWITLGWAWEGLKPPQHRWSTLNLRGLFCAFGGVLLFLLLNIEIADAFQPVGSPSIAFNFEGNFARDMTYTISWALYALGLLALGFWKHNRYIRYPGLGLLAVALLKLFFHDLANIDSIYRIGALIAVAMIALLASFLYQRFLSEDKS